LQLTSPEAGKVDGLEQVASFDPLDLNFDFDLDFDPESVVILLKTTAGASQSTSQDITGQAAQEATPTRWAQLALSVDAFRVHPACLHSTRHSKSLASQVTGYICILVLWPCCCLHHLMLACSAFQSSAGAFPSLG
jgi:hypothetical protein